LTFNTDNAGLTDNHMKRVLLTAFEPYDRWSENASWLALMRVTAELPSSVALTTRRYPVDFLAVRRRIAEDLAGGFDYAIHLGQHPRSAAVQLEAIAVNVGCDRPTPDTSNPLEPDGPVAYRSSLPLSEWAAMLRSAGIPARVSHHAGTYLCNAALYWSCHLAAELRLPTRSAFLHLPLDTSQILAESGDVPSLPVELSAAAVRLILDSLSVD
jgi:pyroglutamyl-peptidase